MRIFKRLLNYLFGNKTVESSVKPQSVPDEQCAHEAYRRLRILEESKFGSQPSHMQLRCDDAHPLYLAHYLAAVCNIMPETIKSATVLRMGDCCARDEISVSKIDDPVYYNMVSDLVDSNLDSQLRVILLINYEAGSQSRQLVMHMQPRRSPSACDQYMSVKVSIASAEENLPSVAHFTYDAELPWRFTTELRRKRVEALRRDLHGLPLDEDDAIALGYGDPVGRLRAGRKLLDENEPLAARHQIAQAYNYYSYRKLHDMLTDEELPYFEEALALMGQSYHNRGLYVKALYYLEALADMRPDSLPPEWAQLLTSARSHHNDFRIDQNKSNASVSNDFEMSKLGTTLLSCFNTTPSDVRAMRVLADDKWLPTKKETTLHTADFVSMMNDYSNVNVFAAIGSTGMLSASLHKLAPNRVRANIMETTDVNDPNIGPNKLVVDYAIDEPFTREAFYRLRDQASVKAVDSSRMQDLELAVVGKSVEDHYYYAAGLVATRDNRWGDALYNLKRAYFGITGKLADNSLDRFDMQMVGALCYQLGFVFSELNRFPQSITYLNKLRGSGNIEDNVELINSLCNMHDFRAYDHIMDRLNKLHRGQIGERTIRSEYHSFLQRRLCYVLIDKGRISEAKQSLAPLLQSANERDRQFARDELQYLQAIYG